jgi:hypothetical protein
VENVFICRDVVWELSFSTVVEWLSCILEQTGLTPRGRIPTKFLIISYNKMSRDSSTSGLVFKVGNLFLPLKSLCKSDFQCCEPRRFRMARACWYSDMSSPACVRASALANMVRTHPFLLSKTALRVSSPYWKSFFVLPPIHNKCRRLSTKVVLT